MNSKSDLVLDVEENPKKFSQWIVLALQHILAMLVACITVPLLTGLPVGATLISAGIGTAIYIFVTRKKSPVFLSSSFAYLSPMFSALIVGATYDATGNITSIPNYMAVIIGMAMVGIVYVAIALVVKFVGTKWLDKLLPPVVIGPIIMVIGLSLASSAINNVTGGTAYIQRLATGQSPDWVSTLISILIALIACFITALTAHYGKKTLGLVPFVVGMLGAYVISLLLSAIGYSANINALQIVNFDALKGMATDISTGKITGWFNVGHDDWMFLLAADSIHKNVFNWGQLGDIALLFIPVSLVTICEHIGDHKNLGNIIGRDLLGKEPGMTRTLIGDGVATAVSGALCGAANTSYGENVGVIGVTKVASTNVVLLAALLTIVFGFFRPFTALLQTIPACVTGGVSLILYGFIAASGVKMLITEKVDFGKTKNIMVASVILVTGIGGLVIKFGETVQITSIAVSMILGIVLNAILVDKPDEKEINKLETAENFKKAFGEDILSSDESNTEKAKKFISSMQPVIDSKVSDDSIKKSISSYEKYYNKAYSVLSSKTSEELVQSAAVFNDLKSVDTKESICFYLADTAAGLDSIIGSNDMRDITRVELKELAKLFSIKINSRLSKIEIAGIIINWLAE